MKKGEKKQDFSQVISAIKELRGEFDKKITEIREEISKKADKELSKEVPKEAPKEETKSSGWTSDFPVPEDYIKYLYETLNSKFGIKVIPSNDSPMFTLQILVPKEYSNADEQIWKDAKMDLRSKILNYGDGLIGVRTFIDLVKANLGPEINAQIQKDK